MRICRMRAFTRGSPSVLQLFLNVVAAHAQLARMTKQYPEQVQRSDSGLRRKHRQQHMQRRGCGTRQELARFAEQRLRQHRNVRTQHVPGSECKDRYLCHRL
jgi:hypothetical protein